MRLQIICIGCVVASLVPGRPLCAQLPDLMGEVVDQSTGLPIPGAQVELLNLRRSVLTDSAGYFEFLDLPATARVVRVSHLGFGTLESGIQAAPGTRLAIELYPAPVELEALEVAVRARSAEPVDPGRPDDFVSTDELRDLEGRVADLVDVLRLKGGPRLQIKQSTGRTGSIDFCIESTRGPATSLGSCRAALLSIDGIVVYWPTPDVGGSGASFATIQAEELLRLRPEEVQNIRFLSPTQAFQRFGEGGRYGALLVQTRRGN